MRVSTRMASADRCLHSSRSDPPRSTFGPESYMKQSKGRGIDQGQGPGPWDDRLIC